MLPAVVLRETLHSLFAAEDCHGFTVQLFTTQSLYPDCSGPLISNPSTPVNVLSLSFNFFNRYPQSDIMTITGEVNALSLRT